MSLLSRIVGRLFRPRRTVQPRAIRAGYDAATYDLTNDKHWQAADSYSPNAQLDSGTRQMLRDRSRYEAGNNGYYGGVIETIAGDVVGSGPRPQVLIPGDEGRKLGRVIEAWYTAWAAASAFAEDLTVMQEAAVRDGESFGVIVDNPGLLNDGRTRVSLDLAVYEAEQVSDPWDFGLDPLYTDGVRVDEYGNPTEYTFLKTHPGGVSLYRGWDTEALPAWQVCHWYKRKRAGQSRGVPWMAAGLNLFAQMRRYTLATLSAAEIAAMLAGIMQTDGAAGDGAAPTIEAMDTVQLARGALLTLPAGWSASQFKAEQPITSYGQFKTEILNEVGRSANVPLNIVSGNSSGYNYSSARLDRQLYYAAIRRERQRMAHRFLDRIFLRWAREAVAVYGVQCPPPETWSWAWFWDGIVSIDPQKDAEADAANLENGTTTLAEICAENGQDWEDVIRQRAAEKKLIAELMPAPTPSVTPPPAGAVAGASQPAIQGAATGKFEEGKHPRAEDGKFGGGASGAAKKAAAKEAAPAETGKPPAKKAESAAAEKPAAAKKTAAPATGGGAEKADPPAKKFAGTVEVKGVSKEELSAAFGRAPKGEELAAVGMAGGIEKPSVRVVKSPDGHVQVRTEGDTPAGDRMTSIRALLRDGDGKLVCHNDSYTVYRPDGTIGGGGGAGTAAFAAQVSQLKAMGVDRIVTVGTRAKGDDGLIGHYVWPRLGYDGDIPRDALAKIPPDIRKGMGDSTKVSALMATPEGRAHWKANGVTLPLTFDLKDGSASMKALEAYQRERAGR